MDFERKVEIEVLVADVEPAVTVLLDDGEVGPLFGEQVGAQIGEQVEVAPAPETVPGPHKPDQTALSAWIDDLTEAEHDHQGDAKAFEAAERLKNALADDTTAAQLARLHEEMSLLIDQEGLIDNFLADTVLDGGAVDVRSPDDDDGLVVPAASGNPYIDDDYNGGGDGGGGGTPGGRTPPGDSEDEPGDGEASGEDGQPTTGKAKAAAPAKKPGAKTEAKPDAKTEAKPSAKAAAPPKPTKPGKKPER